MTGKGYVRVYVPLHPVVKARGKSSTDRALYEHRLVWERYHRRWLKKGEEIHHKDGDRGNNRPENLELWTRRQPTGRRVWDILKDKLAGKFKGQDHLSHVKTVANILVENYEGILVRALVRGGRWKIYPKERRREIEEIKKARQARLRRMQEARQRREEQPRPQAQGLPG